MKKIRSLFIIPTLVIILSIIVTACSGSDDSSATNSKKEEMRSFKTVKGNIEIPTKPKRIVTDYYAGELLSVGGNVVGVEPNTFKNPFLKDLLKNAKDVGDPVNVEKALELQPDLIVLMYDKNYEALSKIAPTIYIPYGTTKNVHETVRLFGDIVGEPQKAEEFLAKFEKKAEEGRNKLKGIIDENATFGLYELTDKGEVWTFGDNFGRGGQALYYALKLKMPEKNATKKETLQLSLEVLPEYAADYMFLTVYDPQSKGEHLKQLQASSIWQGLEAVKNNNVFYNDFDTFYRYDPIAITEQIDLFVDMLIKRAKENNQVN